MRASGAHPPARELTFADLFQLLVVLHDGGVGGGRSLVVLERRRRRVFVVGRMRNGRASMPQAADRRWRRRSFEGAAVCEEGEDGVDGRELVAPAKVVNNFRRGEDAPARDRERMAGHDESAPGKKPCQ